MLHRRQFQILASAAVISVALAGCGSVSQTQVHGYMISETALEQVPVGSSREHVQVVLGTPSTTATVDGEVYYYISTKTQRAVRFMKPSIVDQRVLAVYFDREGRVSRIANYGLQDGVVFDFISRTTPTSGVEATFLQRALTLLQF